MIFAVFFAIFCASALAHPHTEEEITRMLTDEATLTRITAQMESTGKIGESLMRDLKFRPQQKSNIFVSFKNGGTSGVLNEIASSFTPETTHGDRAEAVYSGLNAHAKLHQASCLDFLSSYSSYTSGVQPFWISNEIYVKDSPTFLTGMLANMPNVAKIEKEGRIRAIDAVDQGEPIAKQGTKAEWGVEKIGAPQVWNDANGGLNGSGIIVSVIDTGVRGTHETLKGNYVGAENNGWLDATAWPFNIFFPSNNPIDDQGHGTHCAGSILGSHGLGVAPGAKWMACKALGAGIGIGLESWLLRCMEFSLCPTKPNGSGADCQKAPHIVSNSWGSESKTASEKYENSIAAWVTAGIVPIFAAGNSGPNCGTMGYPGWSEKVISVGATDPDDAITDFSSVGPGFSDKDRQKPEISAPGKDIVSAGHASDSARRTMSGTSMACPHAAGLTALILQGDKNKTLGVDGVRFLLEGTATTNVKTQNKECDGTRDTTFPNYHFGYGRIDAVAATEFYRVNNW